jgi:hypothetical protein
MLHAAPDGSRTLKASQPARPAQSAAEQSGAPSESISSLVRFDSRNGTGSRFLSTSDEITYARTGLPAHSHADYSVGSSGEGRSKGAVAFLSGRPDAHAPPGAARWAMLQRVVLHVAACRTALLPHEPRLKASGNAMKDLGALGGNGHSQQG